MINEPRHWPSAAFNITKGETIRCVSYGSTIYEVFLPIKPESDQASRSNCQFGNKEDKKKKNMSHYTTEMQSATTRLMETLLDKWSSFFNKQIASWDREEETDRQIIEESID